VSEKAIETRGYSNNRLAHVRRLLRMRRSDRLARLLTERELAYLSRAIFRQRTDKPDDEPGLAAQLDPLISVARSHGR